MSEPRMFLERIKMDCFGKFIDKVVGPFSPGLNVVYGPNEAGKSTTSAFVGGVLFGWGRKSKSGNAYESRNGKRSGTLFFKEVPGSRSFECKGTHECEFRRVHNADGLMAFPEEAAHLFDDIDEKTFRTMFALTSDELKGLSEIDGITEKLLMAGSGTGQSPADVKAKLDDMIRTFKSRSSSEENSLVNLRNQLKDCIRRQEEARRDAEMLRADDLEFEDLTRQREEFESHIAEMNAEISRLDRQQMQCEQLLERRAEQLAAIDDLEAEKRDEDLNMEAYRRMHGSVRTVSAVDERKIRERIDDLERRRALAEQSLRDSHEACIRAQAEEQAYAGGESALQKARNQRRAQTKHRVIALVLPVVFLLAALAAFWQMKAVESPVLLIVGILFALAAVVFAAVGLTMVIKANRPDSSRDERRRTAQEKTLQAIEYEKLRREELEAIDVEIAAFVEECAFGDSAPTLSAVREVLDSAADFRETRHRHEETKAQLSGRQEDCRRSIENIDAHYAEIAASVGVSAPSPYLPQQDAAETCPPPADPALIDAIVALQDEMEDRREELHAAETSLNQRWGELKQKLGDGRRSETLDRLKIERAQLETRQEESRNELACLLVARKILTEAMAEWEGQSQPGVYARASQLFSLMTDGAWVKVGMSPDGNLFVRNAVHETLEPRLLSLGACQQLYLSLRIALLECATGVGRAVPVLADDILVNFDESRRKGAVAALAELASRRQVIIFTCHEEVVELIRSSVPDCTVVDL